MRRNLPTINHITVKGVRYKVIGKFGNRNGNGYVLQNNKNNTYQYIPEITQSNINEYINSEFNYANRNLNRSRSVLNIARIYSNIEQLRKTLKAKEEKITKIKKRRQTRTEEIAAKFARMAAEGK